MGFQEFGLVKLYFHQPNSWWVGGEVHEIIENSCFETFLRRECKCGGHSFQLKFVRFHREMRCKHLYIFSFRWILQSSDGSCNSDGSIAGSIAATRAIYSFLVEVAFIRPFFGFHWCSNHQIPVIHPSSRSSCCAQSYQFLMLGLEGAGKTTFLYKLKINGRLGLEKSERSEWIMGDKENI